MRLVNGRAIPLIPALRPVAMLAARLSAKSWQKMPR